jgi:hypothetical protein
MMLNAVVALAARTMVAKEVLDQWTKGAANAGLSAIVAPWLAFVAALFIDNTIDAESAVQDQSLPCSWHAVAS